MKLQPGVGYTFTTASGGASLVIDDTYSPPPSPFTVIGYRDGSDYKVKVVPGTVNNVIPYINGTLMTNPAYTPLVVTPSAGVYVVAIKCNADPAPASFPKTDSEIVILPYPTTDTDTEGYIALAILTMTSTPSGLAGGINQLVSGSLWAERHKYTEPGTASYFFYRV
jgi:hypothetical protein